MWVNQRVKCVIFHISTVYVHRYEEWFINWSTVFYEASKFIVMHGTLRSTGGNALKRQCVGIVYSSEAV